MHRFQSLLSFLPFHTPTSLSHSLHLSENNFQEKFIFHTTFHISMLERMQIITHLRLKAQDFTF